MKASKITKEQENKVLELYGIYTYQKIADIIGITKNQVAEVFRRNNISKKKNNYNNFIGQRFDKLVVIDKDDDYIKSNGVHISMWKCLCDCGNIVSRRGYYLKDKQFHSCGCDRKHTERIGEENTDKYGTIAKIVNYKDCHNITIEYQDEFKHKQIITYQNFCNHNFANPYHPVICKRGMIGHKYSPTLNGNNTKEYNTWSNMLIRCYDKKFKNNKSTYKDVTCCEEWLLYENFYEWLHSQENFDRWKTLNLSALDKDILFKNNKLYSPNTCCLVPHHVNTLFVKNDSNRGEFPIGVYFDKDKNMFCAHMSRLQDNGTSYQERLGFYFTPEEAFYKYKKEKEKYIKQVAHEEYNKGNITKQCYDAMMLYKVEITD